MEHEITQDTKKEPVPVRVLIQIGGTEDDQGIVYDAGNLEVSMRDFGELCVMDIIFGDGNTQQMRHVLGLFEQYIQQVDQGGGEIDPDHVLAVVLLDETKEMTGVLTAPLPLFFAHTSSDPELPSDRIRAAFPRELMSHVVTDFSEDSAGQEINHHQKKCNRRYHRKDCGYCFSIHIGKSHRSDYLFHCKCGMALTAFSRN